MLHFAACVQNIGGWQEYKEGVKTCGPWFNPPLKIVVGIADPAELLKGATAVKA